MLPRRGVRSAVLVLAAVGGLAGVYVGVVLALLIWWEGDTDINGDPVSFVSRLVWVATGLVLLVLSLCAGWWAMRRGLRARRSSGPGDPG